MKNCSFLNITTPMNMARNALVPDGHNGVDTYGLPRFSIEGGTPGSPSTGGTSGAVTNVSTVAMVDFVQPSNAGGGLDMRLARTASVLVGAGQTSVTPTYDIFHTPRARHPCIGAYEISRH